MLHLLSPALSDVDQRQAAALLDAAKAEWDDIPFSDVSAGSLDRCQPSDGDGVVFFNPPLDEHAQAVDLLLAEATEAGAVILPIAMDSEHRRPPGAAGELQSFDVVDQLRRRELTAEQLPIVGAAFAREALGVTMPTFVKSRLRIFLCHRRRDGEAVTAELDAALQVRHEHVFRDLIDIQIAERAQERIEAHLAGADVLVFLDTPDAGESWWVARELEIALGRNIPVVWVRLHAAEGEREQLTVKPGAEPHIEVQDAELSRGEAGLLADEILRVAARLASQHGRTTMQALRRLKVWAAEQRAEIELLNARQQIFQLRHPPSAARAYPLRPASDVLQLFGRAPDDSDRESLEMFLAERGMGPHDHECRAFDAAILLDPTGTGQRALGEWSVTEHPDRLLSYLAPKRDRAHDSASPRLLLLGAFPTGDYARDQITPAVHAAATTWLRLGGSIVCGGHPTFVPLLASASAAILGDACRERLIVYQSEWFAAPAQLHELAEHATVIPTERRDSREESLTVMRNAMISDGNAVVALAIGGRTHEAGTHVPGIDEEIELARAQGIPVYLLGAPGGQAAVLAAKAANETNPWTSLGNGLDRASNELLAGTEEYERAVELIWEASTGR
ncbi:MAG TPA: TIR domain-containing protein [Solirubrobacteraceae bacterium]|jgi:hypothetical protein|nr:TIR domain-containing protein [Solirubrobacteraceae bacterium]